MWLTSSGSPVAQSTQGGDISAFGEALHNEERTNIITLASRHPFRMRCPVLTTCFAFAALSSAFQRNPPSGGVQISEEKCPGPPLVPFDGTSKTSPPIDGRRGSVASIMDQYKGARHLAV